jgi:hypothetical protein
MRRQRAGSPKGRDHSAEAGGDDERRDVDVHRVMRADSADAFIRDPDDGGPVRTEDDLAESLAEEFVHAATSGEDQSEDVDQMVPEEIGGPFLETSAEEEFADGTDESNPADAEAEAMPRAVTGLTGRPREG